MKTYSVKESEIKRDWYVIDAEGEVLGRFASKVARMLSGKHKPIYTPHLDTGDHIVVINAEKIVMTGRKLDDKKYYRHTEYPGGLKTITARKLMEKKPEQIILKAVKGMLPKTTLGRKMFSKLKVYAGNSHGHQAQQPSELKLTSIT